MLTNTARSTCSNNNKLQQKQPLATTYVVLSKSVAYAIAAIANVVTWFLFGNMVETLRWALVYTLFQNINTLFFKFNVNVFIIRPVYVL